VEIFQFDRPNYSLFSFIKYKKLKLTSMKYLFIFFIVILFSNNIKAQEQRLVHRVFVQSSYYKDTMLTRIANQDEKVKLLVDSAEKYRKRVLPKLILSAILYGVSLWQLPMEYVYYNDVPQYDYKSMEQRSSFTLLLSGVAFFSTIMPILKKDYYISSAYKLADLKYPYIPFIQKSILKKYDINKFKKGYLKLNLIKLGGTKNEFERRVGYISNNTAVYVRFRDPLPFFVYNYKENFKYKVLDSTSSSNIVIRCCNDYPLDYYFKDNILFDYKIDESILKTSYIRYSNVIDSLRATQKRRKEILKLKG